MQYAVLRYNRLLTISIFFDDKNLFDKSKTILLLRRLINEY